MKSHRNRLLTLCVLACCLFAVASTASTLDDSVSTDPSDAIDPEWEQLPIGKELASDIRERSQSKPSESGPPATETSDSGGDQEEEDVPGPGGSQGAQPSDESDGESQSGASTAESQQQSGGGSGLTERTSIKRLFQIPPLLAWAALFVCVLVAGVLALRRLTDDEAATPDGPSRRRRPFVGDPTPSNDVSRAWFVLMERFGMADAHHLSPRERASVAVERGANPESTRLLTELFEETRYGDAAVTEESRDRARALFERSVEERRTGASEGWT